MIWVKNVINELERKLKFSSILHVDNDGPFSLVKNPIFNER